MGEWCVSFPALSIEIFQVWLEIFHWQINLLCQFAILHLKYFKLKKLMAQMFMHIGIMIPYHMYMYVLILNTKCCTVHIFISAISKWPVLVMEEAGEPLTMGKQLVNFITHGWDKCTLFFKIFQTKKTNGSDFHAHWNYDSIPHVHVCFDLEHNIFITHGWDKCTLFCNLQSQARTHTILVIGLYELLGNPTTKLIEPPRPCLW
jgi:hypothetical protein